MRPDAVYVAGLDKEHFFSLCMSCKLYNKEGLQSKNVLPDLYSTDWNNFYLSKEKKKYPAAEKKHEEWNKLLEKHKIEHVGSLRIHCILPRIQKEQHPSKASVEPKCQVLGNDVIIYVDQHNASSIFNKKSIETLAEITNTNQEKWK